MRYVFIAIFLIAASASAFSLNETIPAGSGSSTLQQQYKNLKADLEIANGFRMIKMYTMDKFWAIVEDSLLANKSRLNESATLISKQQKDMHDLTIALNNIEKEKQILSARVDSIIVFGKPYSKAGFIVAVSLVMLGLAVLAGILFSISRVSLYTTRELRKLNENMYQEFDTYKRHAVEKEIKLSRELQNYRNKLAELKMA